MRVLHVTDAWAAGVATAVEGWVSCTPKLDHVFLVRGRPGLPPPALDDARMFVLPAGRLAAARMLRRVVAEEGVDVIHAHSSMAGVLARLVPSGAGVAYTPHGYAFQRTDVSWPTRHAFRLAEWLLARSSAVTVACGEHEAQLARSVGRSRRVHPVPYVLPRHDSVPAVGGDRGSQPGGRCVVFMGRLAPQKGVAFAVDVVRALRLLRPDAEAVWVGGGRASDEEQLRRAGVTVTGWVEREAALQLLGAASVYVHTAAWEGLPLTVLEALALGTPVVARELGPLGELRVAQAPTADAVADLIALALTPDGRAALLASAADVVAARPQPEEVARRLTAAYNSALLTAARRSPRARARPRPFPRR